MLNSNFVIAAAALNLIGDSSYARDTFRGRTQPNRVSWLLWGIAPLIAFFAQIGQGVGIQSLMTFMVGFAPLIVLVASLANKKAFWRITKFDFACGVLSVLAIILWLVTGEGNLAISLSIAADLLAGLPTVFKAYKQPSTESYSAFLFGGISAVITLATIKTWTFANAGFAVYIFLICSLLFTLIRYPHVFRRNTTQPL